MLLQTDPDGRAASNRCSWLSEWLGRALHLGDRQYVEDDCKGDKEERYQASGIKQYLIWLVKREQLEGRCRTGYSKEERADEIGDSDGENKYDSAIRDFLASVADEHN